MVQGPVGVAALHSEDVATQPPMKQVVFGAQVPAGLVGLQRLAVVTQAPRKQLWPRSQAPVGAVALQGVVTNSVFVMVLVDGVQPMNAINGTTARGMTRKRALGMPPASARRVPTS
jgi:hypothetical protein